MAWQDFNANMSSIGDYLRQQGERKMLMDEARQKGEMDLQFAIKKAQAEADADPINALIRQATQGGGGNLPPTTTTSGEPPVVPVTTGGGTGLGQFSMDTGKLVRGAISKKFGVPYEQMMTPEERQQANIIEREKEQAKTMGVIPTSEAGRISLANESIKNIQDIRKMLFPSGGAESFKRTTAFASNLPMGSLPVFPSRGWGREEQDVFRKMGAALSGRQLIQTGVAARPEETQKLISQFAPSVGSNPEAAFAGLNELEDFYKNYIETVSSRKVPSGSTITREQAIAELKRRGKR